MGEGAGCNGDLNKDQHTNGTSIPSTSDKDAGLSEGNEEVAYTVTTANETEAGIDLRNEYEEGKGSMERVIKGNIVKRITVDLEKWRKEIESEIRAEVRLEIDDLKKKVKLGEQLKENQQQQLERLERRVEDLQNNEE